MIRRPKSEPFPWLNKGDFDILLYIYNHPNVAGKGYNDSGYRSSTVYLILPKLEREGLITRHRQGVYNRVTVTSRGRVIAEFLNLIKERLSTKR